MEELMQEDVERHRPPVHGTAAATALELRDGGDNV
jgi:hypothetical protein